jgi:hypothetical protein
LYWGEADQIGLQSNENRNSNSNSLNN